MTQLDDPIEIYRRSLASIPKPTETQAPTILRAEAWPYPDLTRLWVRVETGPFAAFPNLALAVRDPDGQIISTLFLVEIREPYQSVTLHLRRPPQPGATYRMEIELSRDEQILDQWAGDFALTHVDPAAQSGL